MTGSQFLKSAIIMSILCIGIALLVPLIQKWNTPDDHKYDGLHRQNDSLVALNIEIDKKYKVLEVRSDSIKKSIYRQEERVVYIKQKQDAEAKIIDHFNGNQLFEYFSNIKTQDSLTGN